MINSNSLLTCGLVDNALMFFFAFLRDFVCPEVGGFGKDNK